MTKSIILDAKQIDMIQKLIRLANNNPNDNEANLAARRVCKMLTDYLFPYIPISNPKVQSASSPPFDPYQDLYNMMRDLKKNARKEQHQQDWTGFTQGREPPGSTREAKQARPETESKPHVDSQGKNPYSEYTAGYYDPNFNSSFANINCPRCKKVFKITSINFQNPEIVCPYCFLEFFFKKGENA